MFRYEHRLLPPTFNNFFLPSSVIHFYLTRGSNLYYKPFAQTNARLFSIRYTGVQTWNDIPLVIKQLPNFFTYYTFYLHLFYSFPLFFMCKCEVLPIAYIVQSSI